jgi:phosphatidylglycerol---prolipoprotein diacylglyceryl transferase
MLPVLFRVGPLEVHSYGVMIATATLLAGYVLRIELERRTGRGDSAVAITVAALVGGFVGARLYFLGEHLGHVSVFGSVSGAGFTWYGGVIGGAGAVLFIARRRLVPALDLLGAAAPALALGYGVGRIACQLAGDGTYGTRTDLPWAMTYPHGVVPTNQLVHPTPVYETLASLVIFALLWRLRRRIAALRLFGLYLVLAGIERFLVEFVRRNEHVLGGLSQPQLFAAGLAVLGAFMLVTAPSGAVPARVASRSTIGWSLTRPLPEDRRNR